MIDRKMVNVEFGHEKCMAVFSMSRAIEKENNLGRKREENNLRRKEKKLI